MGILDERIKKAREQVEKGKQMRAKVEELQARGLSNEAIADSLGVSENTVRRIRNFIEDK